jgi:LAO/AO transport system kinase
MDEKNNSYKPDWTPKNAGKEFATRVVKATVSQSNETQNSKKRNELSVDDFVNGVVNNDRVILARAITLIESQSEEHRQKAAEILEKLLPYTGKSIRIGITRVPGAGKSTLIETFGLYLIKQGHKLAVLTIDPSSALSKGSILGDKTRMEKLSGEENCFIRPSPSGGTLGGVARKTRETISACEAAGYDVILIETVGVGQSEITVRSMVDFFLLVLIAGAGDELQGIKKGVIELADMIAINKADGDNKQKAELAKAEYENALHYLQPATEGWRTKTVTCSALTGEGIPDIWNHIQEFIRIMNKSGEFDKRRSEQNLEWMFTLLEESIKQKFYSHPKVRSSLQSLREKVKEGELLPTKAAEELLKIFYEEK